MHLPQVGVVVDHRLVGPIALFGGGEGREVVGGWNTLKCSLQRWVWLAIAAICVGEGLKGLQAGTR